MGSPMHGDGNTRTGRARGGGRATCKACTAARTSGHTTGALQPAPNAITLTDSEQQYHQGSGKGEACHGFVSSRRVLGACAWGGKMVRQDVMSSVNENSVPETRL